MTSKIGQQAAPYLLRVAELSARSGTEFSITPQGDVLKAVAKELDLLSLKKLRFEGKIVPRENADWQLLATLGATVEQACTISLAKVKTRIDDKIDIYYAANLAVSEHSDDEDEEIEMPEDDSIEALPKEIDLWAVMLEALSLAVPMYPKAKDAELENAIFTEPGKTPMSDEETRPFAGLAGLREQLKNDGK